MRLPFLILGPACVLLGAAAAFWSQGSIRVLDLVLVLVGAIASHISVNTLNEYSDFRSSLDRRTTPTPFSGGSGTLPNAPDAAASTLWVGIAGAVLAAAVGAYYLFVRGVWLLPVGVLGLLVIVTYTDWITHHPLLCLLAPGLGFGTFMVMGTGFALSGAYTWTAFVASLVPFFLVSNLLLLNQFPDAEADRTVGRRHLPIVIGKRASSVVYGLFLLGAYLSLLAGVALRLLPAASLLGLATLFLAVPAARSAYRNAEDTPKLIPALGQNVLINITTPVLVAIGLFIGR
jgi:1,4-dihydroxy-2-naphthoate octaprenyltransferase